MGEDTDPNTAEPMSVADLTAAVHQLEASFALASEHMATAIDGVRDEMRSDGRRSRITLAVATMASIFGIAVIVLGGLLLIRSLSTQPVLDAVRDCTQPGHACYDQNQARSDQRLGPIVGGINGRSDRNQADLCALFDALHVKRPDNCPK